MEKKDFLWSLLAIIMVATLSIGISSCDHDEPELSVNKTSISLQANGNGDKDIIVTASHTGWTATVTEGSSWLRVNKNGQLATISVDANNTTQSRLGKIKIAATVDAALSYDISVDQAGADGTISVNVSSVEFEADGGSQTIMVTSNSGWTASSSQGWLTVNPTSNTVPASGSESKAITLSVGENTTKETRTCSLTITSSDNKASTTVTITQKKPNSNILVNGQESTSLLFTSESGVNYKQTVKVTSNVNWTINNIPEWLSVSPTNGSGEITLNIYPKTDNDLDDKERTAQLVLLSGETRATIKISQETGLDPDAYVIPTNIVTLYNGIAFDYNFGKSASYYYRGYMEKALVASMTDKEIVTILQEKFDRLIQADEEIGVFSGLEENEEYMIYTVAYNKDGKRGKLIKTEASTKKLQNNEPIAWIDDPTTDGSYWYWSTVKSATCNSYYMISTENYEFAFKPDVYQAWMIDYYIRNGLITEYLNGGDWYQPKSGFLIAIMTWGLDKRENYASGISWNYAADNDSSDIRVQKQSKNTKVNKNYKIMGKEKITVYKKR